MSIAVSAVVLPSRLLLAMVGLMSSIAFAIGVGVGIGWIGEPPLEARIVVASLSIFLAFFGFYHGTRQRKPIQLDISGKGQIRLAQVNAKGPCTDTDWPYVRKNGDVVRLLKDTTIWPHLMLLRMQDESGKIRSLAILPDCVSKDSFRALSAACRWVAAHGDSSQAENF